MLNIELSLRGQLDYVPQELLDFRYREKFHITQKELLEEPSIVYNTNIAIMSKILELQAEGNKFQQNQLDRDRRSS